MRLLAIDPGKSTGWALFFEGRLVQCGAVVGREDIPSSAPDQVVIENPVIYPRSKARPNDILKLARTVGWYEKVYSYAPTALVEPRVWKGTIPKALMLKRLRDGLTEREFFLAQNWPHDTVDAIGLGKWYLKNARPV